MIKNQLLYSALAFVLFNQPVFAIDIENGKDLHNSNCIRCHDESVYQRPNRIVNSYQELHDRITQCEIMAEMAWFEEEIDDVTAYLNHAFYHFEMEK